jgi:hypothetical protein
MVVDEKIDRSYGIGGGGGGGGGGGSFWRFLSNIKAAAATATTTTTTTMGNSGICTLPKVIYPSNCEGAGEAVGVRVGCVEDEVDRGEESIT